MSRNTLETTMLTLQQRIYLIKCYGIGEVSYGHAIELFNIKYPGVYVSINSLRKLVRKFDQTGQVTDKKKIKMEHNENDAASLLVMESVRNDPKMSIRKRSTELEVSKSHIQRILKELNLRPFKPVFIHKLEAGDPARRLDFCLTIGERIMERSAFHKDIFFSDESTFTTNGVVSSQNCRYWAEVNPNFKIVTNSQKYKKVNVWCGIWSDRIVGPYFFDSNLNQESYLEMLETVVLPFLDDINLEKRGKLFFQQDGCPAHNAVAVREWLNKYFPEKWLGTFGPINWPARSPDLTPLDFFLWGYLKQKVYACDLQDDVDILKNKITEAVQSATPEMIELVYKEFRRRVEKCVEVGGEHVE